MPRVVFEPLGSRVEVAPGERLLDALDELDAAPASASASAARALPTACRAANCGTCAVEVLSGQGCLEPPGLREREELRETGRQGYRLGCQIRIRLDSPAGSLVILRPVRGQVG